MSGLRNTISIFSLRATAEKLQCMFEKFKTLEIKLVNTQFTSKNLWGEVEKIVSQFENIQA